MAPRVPITEDQNIVFLLSCLRNSQGPINFHKVVEECDIVSVGAATKRFSRLTIKYQNGAGGDDAKANGEEGVATDTDESPSKKTLKKSNRGGKRISKTEKDTMATITAPRAAGVGKKRSPAKTKATAAGTTTAAFTAVTTVDGANLKTEKDDADDGEIGDFVPSFFDEQMDLGVGGQHDDDTD
ncbi:hypothetical protein TMatcc_005985 [Talaromyces marneffei ATCC 18224]|uniref:Myb-like DNA-binding domain-containing protein n=1 Tax=Talaromyces marneffei (strain ATCC 18224 / CBS 334.59 / QM 7333) TaxID=441960 RepID=B6Q8H7_TALMQ|nr:uncharacterized protein EYB26_005521 [Talaromyces marneffei]EEA25781.1 conserved hypothetical protein [Talaromyces marneffei ATCC 18224]KAE8554478.1 hypothetical protein EYB25_003017 [Talaromyces marneffei]QGA17845.1 hypothetical protein EYB26_005521 [Talaromyces marneffei]